MKLIPRLKIILSSLLSLSLIFTTALFIPSTAQAQETIDLAQGEQDLTIYGAAFGAGLTRSGIASGDFNGDGIGDILTSTDLGESPNLPTAVIVFFGSSSIGGTIDLASQQPDLIITPKDILDLTDASLAAGDINGDGIDDIVIGAHEASGPGILSPCNPTDIGDRCGGGEVYVIFGSASLSGTIDLATVNPDVLVYGAERGDKLGWKLATGDINGDGIEDILVGAPDADGPGSAICADIGFVEGTGDRCSAGEAYVIFGSTSLPGVIDLLTTTPNLIIYGDVNGNRLGMKIAAGDVNGDGIKDVLVTNSLHHLYAIFGSPTLSGIKDIALGQQNLTILAKDFEHRFRALASGDVNGDGADDILLSARGNGPGTGTILDCGFGVLGDRCGAGEVYAIFGSPTLSGVKDIALGQQDLTIFGKEIFDSIAIRELAVGDVNGDGWQDILIPVLGGDGPGTGTSCGQLDGAPFSIGDRCNAGEAYVIFGSPTLSGALDLATTSPGLTVFGTDPNDRLGWKLAAGDINGDGIEDLLLGAYLADGPGTGSCPWGETPYGGTGDRCNAGELYVIFGKSADSDGDGIPDSQDACPLEDASGFDANADGCIDTIQGLTQIITTLPDGALSDEIKTSLVSKVENAQKSSDKSNICAGVNQLQAFINEVDGQRGKKVSDEAANDLIAFAQSVIAALNSQLPAGETCK